MKLKTNRAKNKTKSADNWTLNNERLTVNMLIAEYPESAIPIRQVFAAYTLIHERLNRLPSTFRTKTGSYRIKTWAEISLRPHFTNRGTERGLILSLLDYSEPEGIRQTIRLFKALAIEEGFSLFAQLEGDLAIGTAEGEGFRRLRKNVWRLD